MKDSIVRGRVLELLFERRNDDPVLFGGAAGAVPAPPGIDPSDWLRAVAQLAECGLIDWKPLKKETRGATMAGLAKITDAGMIVLKGGESGPLQIRFPGDATP